MILVHGLTPQLFLKLETLALTGTQPVRNGKSSLMELDLLDLLLPQCFWSMVRSKPLFHKTTPTITLYSR
jgi:hypothetical protein